MMVTEKEARQMICPMSLSTTPVTTVFCRGPLCMAWRWGNKLELSWTDEFPPKDDGLGKWKFWQHRADGKVGWSRPLGDRALGSCGMARV